MKRLGPAQDCGARVITRTEAGADRAAFIGGQTRRATASRWRKAEFSAEFTRVAGAGAQTPIIFRANYRRLLASKVRTCRTRFPPMHASMRARRKQAGKQGGLNVAATKRAAVTELTHPRGPHPWLLFPCFIGRRLRLRRRPKNIRRRAELQPPYGRRADTIRHHKGESGPRRGRGTACDGGIGEG